MRAFGTSMAPSPSKPWPQARTLSAREVSPGRLRARFFVPAQTNVPSPTWKAVLKPGEPNTS